MSGQGEARQDEVEHTCTTGNCTICGQLEMFPVDDVAEPVGRWFALEHAEPEKLVECSACGGNGFREVAVVQDCFICHVRDHEVPEQDCSMCHGRGKVSEVVALRAELVEAHEALDHLTHALIAARWELGFKEGPASG